MARNGCINEAHPDDLLAIGKALKAWGLKGHVKVYSYAESIDTYRRVPGLYIQKNNGPSILHIEAAKQHKKFLLLKFRERDCIEEVEDLIGTTLYMHKQDLPSLEEGEYYWFQLIGMQVQTDCGKQLGILREILDTGGHDVYVVRQGDRELLIPALKDVIRDVYLAGKQMIVRPMEGMLNEHDL